MTAEPEPDPGPEPGEYASPPCLLHTLHAAEARPGPQRSDILLWRKAVRERLLGERRALHAEDRQRLAAAMARHLDALVGELRGLTVSGWWPIQAEFDLRPWLAGLAARGAAAALPVVVGRGRPLAFRRWAPGVTMTHSFWNIPAPSDGPEVTPDVVLAPVVGFDGGAFRLGYGGGYFDRTLAALAPRPRAIGVGVASARLPSIHPLPHEIPMTAIVTEAGVIAPAG